MQWLLDSKLCCLQKVSKTFLPFYDIPNKVIVLFTVLHCQVCKLADINSVVSKKNQLNLHFLWDIKLSIFFEYQSYKTVTNISNDIYFSFHFIFNQKKYTAANKKALRIIGKKNQSDFN